MKTTALFLLLFTITFTIVLTAQVIPVKTYPVLSDESMLQIPSANEGMGHISFAMHDRFADPFRNPSLLAHVNGSVTFFLPRWSGWNYSQTEGSRYILNNSNRSTQRSASNTEFTTGVMAADSSFGLAAVVGFQHMQSSFADGWSGSTPVSSSFSASQHPVLAAAGVSLAEGISLGASIMYIPLKGFDGIQFLYPNSSSVHASGTFREYRLGMSAGFASSSLDLVVGKDALDASSGATYQWSNPVENKDKNSTIFTQAIYTNRISEKFSIAASMTANWKDLPKLPNYPIAGIWRDPGYTHAFNLGGGLTYAASPTTLFACEYLYEPISTNTWVEAQQTETLDGRTFAQGDREQENNYDFHNHIIRFGVQLQPEEWLTLQAGTEMHSYSYSYEMKNYITNFTSNTSPQNEWTEMAVTAGVSTQFGSVRIAYNVQMLTGRGMLEQQPVYWLADNTVKMNDILLVPNSSLRVHPVTVTSHLMTVMYLL